jgi:hypothetical protein
MGWAVGSHEGRDIGYGVPAICDQPGCEEKIDRGLGYVCGQPWDGDEGCGLFFCMEHGGGSFCERCDTDAEGVYPFDPKPDLEIWILHKLNDESWAPWRAQNPGAVNLLRQAVTHA